MLLLASIISSGDTEPSRFWAVIKFTRGVVRVTDALKDDCELDGFVIPRPPSLDGRAEISLSILEQGGRPVSAAALLLPAVQVEVVGGLRPQGVALDSECLVLFWR